MRPSLKNKLKAKRAEDMAQVVECLPTKLEALSSNPSNVKKKKERRKKEKEKKHLRALLSLSTGRTQPQWRLILFFKPLEW
jgi:hypothetical protein